MDENVIVECYESMVSMQERPHSERFCAFLLRLANVTDGAGKKTGEQVYQRLPMVFFSSTEAAACNRAKEFWTTETAKVQARKDRLESMKSKGQKKIQPEEAANG
jgi:hypothetical protein